MLNIEKLKKIIRGKVDISRKTRSHYSRDASLFEITPQVVVFPRDVSDIKKLVAFAASETVAGNPVSLTARAAGTDMTGGPLGDSIVVDFTRHFTHLKSIEGDRAIAEPGMMYRDFDRATRAKGLIMPSYPASREICTIGGMVANNSGGEKTLVYGKTEKYVKRLKVVLADGNEYEMKPLSFSELAAKKMEQTLEGDIYRRMHALVEEHYDRIMAAKPDVSKNSSGYYLWNILDAKRQVFDLTKLFVGSQGTLGLITEIEFALVRPKPFSRLLIIFLPDMQLLADVVNRLLRFSPESIETYDDHTFRIAVRFFPQLVKQLKGNIVSLFFRFIPDIIAVLRGGIPKLVLLAEFTGKSAEEAEGEANHAMKDLDAFHIKMRVTRSAADAEKYWTIRRESFNLLRKNVKNLHTAPCIDDLVVRPEKLPEFLPKLYAILDQYDLMYTIAGHAGDGNFHIIPLMNLSDPKVKSVIRELMNRVYPLVAEFGGSPSGEHNDGLIRAPFLELFFGKEVEHLFEETKRIFDSHGIFNPHKKIGVSLAYALERMVQ